MMSRTIIARLNSLAKKKYIICSGYDMPRIRDKSLMDSFDTDFTVLEHSSTVIDILVDWREDFVPTGFNARNPEAAIVGSRRLHTAL
jgi:hypothetical protein